MDWLKRTRVLFTAALLVVGAAAAYGADEEEAPASAPAVKGDANAPIKVSDYAPPIRVACLGDSITFGVGSKGNMAYPDQLDRMLGEDWDVRNFGHSGATIAKGGKHNIWGTKEYKAALEFHPDVVIIMLGTNDSKTEAFDLKTLPKLYKNLITSFSKLSSKPRIFCAYPPYVKGKGSFDIDEGRVQQIMPVIKQVGEAWGCGIIDMHTATKSDAFYKGDNVHPSNEGATALAKTAYKALTGKEFQGDVPSALESKKTKLTLDQVPIPGDISYQECYGMIAATGMPTEKLEPIRTKFEETAPDLRATIQRMEAESAACYKTYFKYKHSEDAAEKKAGSESKTKSRQLLADVVKLKRDKNYELIAMIPKDFRDEFGSSWVNKYVLDRLFPISSTLTPEQKKKIREMCRSEGVAYGNINNTPERSISDVEVYKKVWAEVLTPDQQKRVESH